MKTYVLKKILRENGAYFVKEAREHERWRGRNGAFVFVPRHKNTNDYTAQGILKKLGIL